MRNSRFHQFLGSSLAALLAAFVVAGSASSAVAANGWWNYLDVNGATAGFGSPSGTINASALSWTTDAAGSTATGAFASGGQLVFASSGSYIINADVNFTGVNITTTGATVTLGTPSSGAYLTSPATWTVATGSTLIENFSRAYGALNWNNCIINLDGGGTITFQTSPGFNAKDSTITQNMTGAVNLASGWTGGTSYGLIQANYTLAAGTLNFSAASASGAFNGMQSSNHFSIHGGTIDNTSGSAMTFDTSGAIALSGQYSIAIGGDFAFTGTNDLSFGTKAVALGTVVRTITANANTLMIGGVVSGTPGGITKAGNGTLTLTGSSTYTGVTKLSAGTLSVATIGNGGVAGGLGQATHDAANLVFDGGTLNYTGITATSDRAFTIPGGKSAMIDITNSLSLAGATGPATSGALTKLGPGTLTLSGVSTYTGDTTVSAGTLSIATPCLADSSTVRIAAGAVLNLPHGVTDTVGQITFDGVLQARGTYNATNSGGRLTGSGSLSSLPGTSIASLRVAAPTTGISSATFTVVLSLASATPVSVHYSTVDGSALAGTDYTATSGTLVFAAGETSKTVDVPILANSVAQPDKTFSLALSAASGAILTQSSALCTIITSSLAPPSNPLATVTGTSGIKLTWSAPPFVPDGYILERSANGSAYVTLATLPAGTNSYLDTTVQAGVTYSYRLVSYNSVVTSANSATMVTTWTAGANTFPPLAFAGACDYGAMWWRGGVRGERVWQIKTSRYAMTFDCDALNLTTVFPLSAYLPETAALVQPNDQSFPAAAPVSSLACSLTASGTQYAIQTASTNRADAQLVESGKFYQRRWQKIQTAGGPALINNQSGLEICAWPDRVSIVCRAVPAVGVSSGRLDLTLSFQNIYHILSSSGLAQAFGAADGSGFVVLKSNPSSTLTTDAANTRVTVSTDGGTWLANQERSVGLIIYPSTSVAGALAAANALEGGQLTVTASQIVPRSEPLYPFYDLERGYFNIPLRSDVAEWDVNHFERSRIHIANNSATPQVARFAFTKTTSFPGVPGMTCIIRDLDGNPLGIQVQLSKNWHQSTGERWQGAWFHGLTMFTVPANTSLSFEVVMAGQNYGAVPAASHSQLALIGYASNGNQQWEEAAIGCWGETFCYDPESDLASAIGTDSRPLMLLSNTGQQQRWTANYGGCDFLRYYDASNTRRFQQRIRTRYQRYGPNLADVTYAGLTDNSKIEFQYSAGLYRSNDFSRGLHRLRYDVKSDAAFTRMVFFQMASDNYNYGGGTTHAYGYGDQLSQTAQWTTTNVTTPVELTGNLPWFSTLNCPSDPTLSRNGSTRGFIIRSWNARINGQDGVKPYFVSNGSRFDLVPPPGVTSLKAGDYVEAEIERVYFGQVAADYYGGDANFATTMQSYGNTHSMVVREAIGNDLAVGVTQGTLERSYPIQIRTIDNTAGFSVTGGIGYVPVTFTGLSDYRDPLLEERIGPSWVPLSQAFDGKDFWQAEHEPATASWQITFNVKLDRAYQNITALRDAPVTRTFRLRRAAAPVTWSGRATTTSWALGSNWLGGLVPVAGDAVTVGLSASVANATNTFSALDIQQGATVTFGSVDMLAGSKTVHVAGTLDRSGVFRFNGSTVNLSGRFGSNITFLDTNSSTMNFHDGAAFGNPAMDFEHKGTNTFGYTLSAGGFTTLNAGVLRSGNGASWSDVTYNIDISAYHLSNGGTVTLADYTGSTMTGDFASGAKVNIIRGGSGLTGVLSFDPVTSSLLLALSPQSAYANWVDSSSVAGGKLDDDDHDGLTNLEEYAWGTLPGSANGRPVHVAINPGGHLELTASKGSAAGADPMTAYRVEASLDLVTWTTAGVTITTNDATDLVASYTGPPAGKVFLRVVITN